MSDLRERMGQMRLSGGAAADGGAVAAAGGGGGLSRPNSARSSLNGAEMREMSSSFESLQQRMQSLQGRRASQV